MSWLSCIGWCSAERRRQRCAKAVKWGLPSLFFLAVFSLLFLPSYPLSIISTPHLTPHATPVSAYVRASLARLSSTPQAFLSVLPPVVPSHAHAAADSSADGSVYWQQHAVPKVAMMQRFMPRSVSTWASHLQVSCLQQHRKQCKSSMLLQSDSCSLTILS